MLRVLAAHWPQFLGLCLLGAIGRMGFLWLALWAARAHALLGALILPLAPLCALFPLLLMLRVADESLPAFRDTQGGLTARGRWRDHMRVASRMMLPFITLYTTEGLLAQDARAYVYDITNDEIRNSLIPSWDRLDYAEGWVMVALIVTALVLRKLIALTGAANRVMALTILAIYLEAMWMLLLARTFMRRLQEIGQWLADRVFFDALARQWEAALNMLGPLRSWVEAGAAWVGTVASGVTALVVLPITWLAVGAACYQTELRDSTRRPVAARARRQPKSPSWLTKIVAETIEPVATPVQQLWAALSRVATAGVAALVLFCFSYLIVAQSQLAVAWLVRAAVGPRGDSEHLMLLPYADVASQLVYFVLAMALLAAALNLIMGGEPLGGRAARALAVPSPGSRPQGEQQVLGGVPPQPQPVRFDPRRYREREG